MNKLAQFGGVPGSYLGRDSDYRDEFRGIPQYLQTDAFN
jgi:hypothetical protein